MTHEQKWVADKIVGKAQKQVARYGVPVEVSPEEALLGCLAISTGHLIWLRMKIDSPEFDESDRYERRAWLKLYDDERDRLAKLAKAALDIGVAEKQVKAIERIGATVADLLKLVFDDERLALSAEQRAELPAVLREHFPSVTGGNVFTQPLIPGDDYDEWDDDELIDELEEREVEFHPDTRRERLIYLLRDDDALYARAQNGR